MPALQTLKVQPSRIPRKFIAEFHRPILPQRTLRAQRKKLKSISAGFANFAVNMCWGMIYLRHSGLRTIRGGIRLGLDL
jgi:hypothetical protein